MAYITKITTQKKATDRYNVFLDYGKGEEYAFSVDEDVLIKFQLKKGMELDEFSIMEIHYQDDIRKAYNMAIQFLSRRMRTELEVRNYLMEKEMDEPIIQEVIHRLYHYQFLNDEEYALAFVRTQKNTTDKGPGVVKRELDDKGVSQKYIEKALKQYSFDEQLLKATQICQKLIEKNKRDSERLIKQKVEQFLFKKGYSSDLIQLALEEVNQSNDENMDMEALVYQGEKAHKKYSQLNEFEYKNKMKQTLYRKGFSIDLIEEFINKKMNEDSE